jgi:cytochrome c biogenesis protein CcmG/thiol:disulfide interchange protein DsbE
MIRAARICALAFLTFLSVAAHAEKSLDLDRYRGKVVLLDFWASWCEPCRHSFPWLNAMQAKYAGRGLVVIGVNVDRQRTDADRFLHEVPATFPIIFDPAGELATHYDVPGMPSSFVIGRSGEVVNRHVGFREGNRDERELELQKLLTLSANDKP